MYFTCRELFTTHLFKRNNIITRRYMSLLLRHISSNCSSFTTIVKTNESEECQKGVVMATVVATCSLSPTVRGLQLRVDNKHFSFKAGQWVDFNIPTQSVIAGYSVCSSPRQLQQSGLLELAVKLSRHPPSVWVHTQCSVGNQIGLVAGGDFYYDPQSGDSARDVLLIAGGVGINPLISIMRHVADMRATAQQTGSDRFKPARLVLLYSASTADELIFKDEISRLVGGNDNMSAQFFVTRQNSEPTTCDTNILLHTQQQIDQSILTSVLKSSFDRLSDVDCYVCGPCAMIDDVDAMLLKIGLDQNQIKYEKWW